MHAKAIQALIEDKEIPMDAASTNEILEHAKAIQVVSNMKLYHARITFIECPGHVQSDGDVCAVPVPVTTFSIVEMVNEFPRGITNRIDLLKDGKCLETWDTEIWNTRRPMIFGGHNDPYVENRTEIAILHELTPVIPAGSKRRRL